MAIPSPLLTLQRQAGAVLMPFGARSEQADPDGAGGAPIDVVATFGELEVEYASIRRHCALIDTPQRVMIELRGGERVDFLNRMLTQELKGLAPWSLRRSFWLGRDGRIVSDLRVVHLPERTLLECDAITAARCAAQLAAYIISEDCEVLDASSRTHRLALVGPRSRALLARAGEPISGVPGVATLERGSVCTLSVRGQQCVVYRDDLAGVECCEIVAPASGVLDVVRGLIEVGHDTSHERAVALPVLGAAPASSAREFRLTLAGWMAWNIARIEGGRPEFLIDYGPRNLPAETGVIESRVSFTKGCYLGQEIVARMHARKQVKQALRAIRFDNVHTKSEQHPYALVPESGTALSLADGSVVGAVTSSTLSPMLSMSPIAFAQVRAAHAQAGVEVYAETEGVRVRGVVQESLTFVPG